MAKFSDMLGYLRKREGISQQELADKLKISRSAIGMYESGSRTPDLETLEAMADLFNVNLDTLLGKNSTNSVVPTALLQIDTRLNKLGHQEWTRYGEYLARQKVYQKEVSEALTTVRIYTVPAAAGYASPVEGEDYEVVQLPDVPYGADFAIKVSGDSMEPYIKNGDIVFVNRRTDLDDFDVGVFYLNGDVLIKQVVTDSLKNVHLLSANPKREDANKTVYYDSNDSLVCLGRVIIGKLPQPKYI